MIELGYSDTLVTSASRPPPAGERAAPGEDPRTVPRVRSRNLAVFAVARLASRLATARSIPDIAAEAVEAAVAAMGADAGRLLLHDPDRDQLVASASCGFAPDMLERMRVEEAMPRAVASAFAELRTVVIPDVAASPYASVGHLAGIRSIVATPLWGRESQAIGALAVYFHHPRRPGPVQTLSLELVARHAGLVLENERGRERRTRELTAFQAIRAQLESRVAKAEDRRRALMHILGDINEINRRLSDQRKAMLHILADYERDRSRLGRQTERLDASRRALLNILKDAHQSNERLARSRKAMIHIMRDLNDTTVEVRRREQELRDKQEQLVQAGKLATLGELTTGVAHELNNPLNNIGLYVGNVIDLIRLGEDDQTRMLAELNGATLQVRKATEIITHLRTFGRSAVFSREIVRVNPVIRQSLSLLHEQLRLRLIEVTLDLSPAEPIVLGNPIQLEQVLVNLMTNARDAMAETPAKRLKIGSRVRGEDVEITVEDSGPGVPKGLERRIFDPFFTTKEVGSGTGLGLSITYGIIREHQGAIVVETPEGGGARFVITLPLSETGAAA